MEDNVAPRMDISVNLKKIGNIKFVKVFNENGKLVATVPGKRYGITFSVSQSIYVNGVNTFTYLYNVPPHLMKNVRVVET